MNGQPIPASELRVEIIHGGDAAAHHRRLSDWLAANAGVQIYDVRTTPLADERSKSGVTFTSVVLHRAG